MTDLTAPSSYSGLYAFHKYWGKKPVEPLRALMSVLSDKGDIVADPFLGSGAIAKEAASIDRRFIGSEINPIAVRLAKFGLNPCSKEAYAKALRRMTESVRELIRKSYDIEGVGVTSHLLWENGFIEMVWQRPASGTRRRLERAPTKADYELASAFDEYELKNVRDLVTFKNSRINSTADLSWKKLFSGRALRNIDILVEAIRALPDDTRTAMELTLTSAIGQMSRMVFAITSRGKTTGTSTGKVEVGSWVIGFWRPRQHFEINVWNCFESRANKLLKALPDLPEAVPVSSSLNPVLEGSAAVYINQNGAASLLSELPKNSLQLVVTDPPHGDRIPYLELSEIWNAVIGLHPEMQDEIVVSNAVDRRKDLNEYNSRLTNVLSETATRVRTGGFIVLLFNSRHQKEWQALDALGNAAGVRLIGSMPLNYSAQSVVQDNREGAMKTDFIVVYGKGASRPDRLQALESVPGWNYAMPTERA